MSSNGGGGSSSNATDALLLEDASASDQTPSKLVPARERAVGQMKLGQQLQELFCKTYC